MTNSFWNLKNIDKQVEGSPNAILKEQANYFEKATKDVLYASITNIKLKITDDFEYKLATKFSIVSRALDNYTYNVFTVYSNPEVNYPIAITINENEPDDFDWFEPKYTCENQESFIEAIKEIISSEKTTKMVHTLYSKSKNY